MIRRIAFASIALLATISLAKDMPAQPYPAVKYVHEEAKDPAQQLFIAHIDLTNKNVRIRVAPAGADPDGDGHWQTVLKRPTAVADHEGFDLVVNGDFFEIGKKDAEGEEAQKVFESGLGATVKGPAVTDGKLWAPAKSPRASFIVHNDGHVSIADIQQPPSDAMQVIAGSDIIVKAGKNVAPKGKGFPNGPHPRTVVGIADKGKRLVLLVGDGRTKIAKGWALSDLADVMIKLGCEDAVNLDGGGSSMLGIRDPQTHKMEIMNHPSDGKERSVGNVLGVTVTPKKN